MMKILVTGAGGFIAKNLLIRLNELEGYDIISFSKENTIQDLCGFIDQVDFIIHLAGVNRPLSSNEFITGNTELTEVICKYLIKIKRSIPILFASSIQASLDNPYGKSKLGAEEALSKYSIEAQAAVHIYRLPNVFGKWCKPNYNSVVATFCQNIANDLPINIHDKEATLTLVHIDDVIDDMLRVLKGGSSPVLERRVVSPEYKATVGEIASNIEGFRKSRKNLVTPKVGKGLLRALYSTYVSYLPIENCSYEIPKYGDERGVFVEMLKTSDAGQFSFFTAHPGVVRGGHYHHTKTEKFLVIKGNAKFGFRHVITDEVRYLETSGDSPRIVETLPGWAHDITNIGTDEMVVMLWANEVFDPELPDTYKYSV